MANPRTSQAGASVRHVRSRTTRKSRPPSDATDQTSCVPMRGREAATVTLVLRHEPTAGCDGPQSPLCKISQRLDTLFVDIWSQNSNVRWRPRAAGTLLRGQIRNPIHRNVEVVRITSECIYHFGLMNNTSARSIHPLRRSTRNQPSLFFGWKRTGDRGPNSARSYCAQVLPKSGDMAMPVA